jgi:hypothetical protein
MDADNLNGPSGVHHRRQGMTAVLFDFATHADYRAAVKKNSMASRHCSANIRKP